MDLEVLKRILNGISELLRRQVAFKITLVLEGLTVLTHFFSGLWYLTTEEISDGVAKSIKIVI